MKSSSKRHGRFCRRLLACLMMMVLLTGMIGGTMATFAEGTAEAEEDYNVGVLYEGEATAVDPNIQSHNNMIPADLSQPIPVVVTTVFIGDNDEQLLLNVWLKDTRQKLASYKVYITERSKYSITMTGDPIDPLCDGRQSEDGLFYVRADAEGNFYIDGGLLMPYSYDLLLGNFELNVKQTELIKEYEYNETVRLYEEQTLWCTDDMTVMMALMPLTDLKDTNSISYYYDGIMFVIAADGSESYYLPYKIVEGNIVIEDVQHLGDEYLGFRTPNGTYRMNTVNEYFQRYEGSEELTYEDEIISGECKIVESDEGTALTFDVKTDKGDKLFGKDKIVLKKVGVITP